MSGPTPAREVGVASSSPYLAELIGDAERLAGRCAAAAADRRSDVAARCRDASALASLRLDGSPISGVPSAASVTAARTTVDAATLEDPRRGTWFDALRAFDGVDPDDPEAVAADAAVHALEFDGVVTANASDDLAPVLLTDPLAALRELHGRLTRHLVAPERVGQLRVAEQAVHDASVGRVMYFTVDPARIADELGRLGAWLTAAGGRQHGLVVAGVAHLELLRIHPFDAANGRLARAAARLLLRVHGLDPEGLAAPEPVLDADRVGYHDEVASTSRRRDATMWLERWGEAVTEGLRRSARALEQLETDVPDDVAAFLAGRGPGSDFTVADHRAALAPSAAEPGAHLRVLLDAGRIERVSGSRGLRFRVA